MRRGQRPAAEAAPFLRGPMATESDLKDRVLHLLESTAVSKVEFTLDGVNIASASFSQVALAIRDKAAGKSGIGFSTEHLPAGADAGYSPSRDVFKVPSWDYGTTGFQRQAIVHEAIHAYLDIISSTKPALTDEALAYVGGVLFHIHDTTAAEGTPTAPWWAGDQEPVFKEAFRIASGLFTSGSKVVSDADAKSMRDTIMAHPGFAHLKADPMGRYRNNGLK
jgi:hypothetical protein